MRALTDLEYDILNALYFVEPFEKIVEEVGGDENIIADGIKFLIDRKLVVPMKWDSKSGRHVRSFIYDSDNMRAYHYLATKEGLSVHNSR